MPQKAYGSGANAVPMGKLHPILAAKRQEQSQGQDHHGGQRPPLPPMNYGSPAPYQPLPPPSMPMTPQPRPPLPVTPYPESNNGSSKRSLDSTGSSIECMVFNVGMVVLLFLGDNS